MIFFFPDGIHTLKIFPIYYESPSPRFSLIINNDLGLGMCMVKQARIRIQGSREKDGFGL